MKKLFIIIALFSVTVCSAQSISVSSFKLLDTDLTANTAGTMETDQNGETAALIKVVTTQTGFTFDGGALGIVKTIQKPSEIWVYVPRGLKKITISHPQLGMLRDYYLNIPIEAARTFEMVLVAGEVQTIVKQARTSQYVVFELTPPDAVVELNGELLKTEGGVASKMVKFGTYNYRVKAPDYLPEAGSVTIDDPNNKKVVTISLKPNFAQVSISVDNDAEIWINGEKKGNGSWSGNLGAGTYELEAKKAGHRSTLMTQDIEVVPEPLNIKLQAPVPIYGEADINSSPGMADIYIDGNKVGQTPLLVPNLLVGEHQVRISKKGYVDNNSIISVKESEQTQVLLILNKTIQTDSPVEKQDYSNIDTTPLKSDPKIIKEIMKTNSYSQAEYLLKNSLSKLNNKDKATAYNKLVDFALDEFSSSITNLSEKQRSESAYNAVLNGLLCDKYDQMPDEKGRVSPKYAKNNSKRLWLYPRNQLVNAGQDALSAHDNASARKYWELFALSDSSPMFIDCDREAQKPYFGQVARYAAIFAYQDKDMQKALQLADIAMKDPVEYDNALNLKLEILGDGLQTKEDSVNYCNKLKEIYAEHKTDGVMEKLYNTLTSLGQETEANQILDDALAANPDNVVALADKGLGLINKDAAEAAKYLKRAAELKDDNALIQTYAGTALSVQAQNTEDAAAKKAIYEEAIKFYDKAKELDPDMLQAKWGYNRFNAYYNYYGPDAPETQQAEADSK